MASCRRPAGSRVARSRHKRAGPVERSGVWVDVLHLSTSDIDGGAARAAYRLHHALRLIGVNSQMLVQSRASRDTSVSAAYRKRSLGSIGARLRPGADRIPFVTHQNAGSVHFSTQWIAERVAHQVHRRAPNVVHLHWICDGYLQIESLPRLGQPIVWTLHDMWGFTGGCHYSEGCDRYGDSCGRCPQLPSGREKDVSRWVWRRKARAWRDWPVVVVSPSRWLAECARQSSLLAALPIHVIPHGLDLALYRPVERQRARALLRIPDDGRRLVLFGAVSAAADRRKGFDLFNRAVARLMESGTCTERVRLATFGADPSEITGDLGMACTHLGVLRDDLSLVLAYSAADAMVVPSREEAFGQTASEALACGAPVVCFDTSGLREIVDHGVNGYRAVCYDPGDLARGIAWVLEDEHRVRLLTRHAREKAQRVFSVEAQARAHERLYREMLEAN